jgi:hypothetical protein
VVVVAGEQTELLFSALNNCCWFGVLLNVGEVAFPTFPVALQGSLTRAKIDADFKDTSAITRIRRYAHYLTIQ